MTAIAIRPASTLDVPELSGLVSEFYAEQAYPFDRAGAEAALATLLGGGDVGRAWLVLCGGQAVGYAVLTFGFSLEYGGRDGFLDEIYLRPEFRNRGVGSELLSTLQGAAADLGVRALHLEVEGENDAAASLYRRQGFAGNERRLLTKRL